MLAAISDHTILMTVAVLLGLAALVFIIKSLR